MTQDCTNDRFFILNFCSIQATGADDQMHNVSSVLHLSAPCVKGLIIQMILFHANTHKEGKSVPSRLLQTHTCTTMRCGAHSVCVSMMRWWLNHQSNEHNVLYVPCYITRSQHRYIVQTPCQGSLVPAYINWWYKLVVPWLLKCVTIKNRAWKTKTDNGWS